MGEALDFREVYRGEFSFLWRLVWRLGARRAELEDRVHDVFTVAFRHWSALDASRPVRPWLCGIAYRVMLDHHRKRSTHQEQPVAEVPETAADGTPAEAAEEREGLGLALRIIRALELDRRTVFVLHELEGLPVPEVAESLGIPLNTAYSRLRLARRDFEAAAKKLTEGDAR